MKPLSDLEKIEILIARERKSGYQDPQKRVLFLIGIDSRSTLKNLRDDARNGDGDGNLKSEAVRRKLNHEFSKFLVEPGSDEYRAFFDEIKNALGDESAGKLPDIKQMDRYLIPLAYGVWAIEALNPGLPAAYRILIGRKAHRVMFDWLKAAKRRRAVKTHHFTVPDDQVAQRGVAVVEALVAIVAEHPDPPPGFFDHGDVRAQRNGYRMFRIILDSDHTGWLGMSPGLDTEDRTRVLANAYKRGLADDLTWLRKVMPSEIGCSYNAWLMAMNAGDWKASLRFAEGLFEDFPILKTSVMGLKAVKDDPEMWPGIAAVMEDRSTDGLDELRAILKSGDPDLAEMVAAAERARSVIARCGSYPEAIKAMVDGEKK
ncbi:hypothetical protein NKI38_19475 [Mesorhizobium sp. M0621]|uniref:hypothetical protein n=1 Tax=Mesorhizobium sp. M0621 TaxID=2956974 RepID=UPI0033380484